jgi:hypothetical protein
MIEDEKPTEPLPVAESYPTDELLRSHERLRQSIRDAQALHKQTRELIDTLNSQRPQEPEGLSNESVDTVDES